MNRKHLFRLIILIALLAWAVYELWPTYKLSGLNDERSTYVAELSELTSLDPMELETALSVGELEMQVSNILRDASQDTFQRARELSAKLVELKDSIYETEGEALKQGLDLLGGTYLVYEADLVQLARNLAKDRDEEFTELLEVTTRQYKSNEGGDFFSLLRQNFRERNIPLNRYYGRRGQSDDVILEGLREQAQDAISITLEKLRNRVDQFGVSEPDITSQGDRRIIIQLAGVQDIDRAKQVINTTAFLEFQLLRDSELTMSVLQDIDKRLKRIRSVRTGDDMPELPELELSEADTTAEDLPDGKKTDDEEIDLSELFGKDETEAVEEDTAGADSTILVDKQTFEEYPFFSLLRYVEGMEQISVPLQNVAAVRRILQMPEIQEVVPRDSEFLWGRRDFSSNNQQFTLLYFVKKEPELVGAYIKDASVAIASGESQLRTGQAQVTLELNGEGAKIFRRVTGANVGKFLAIVLDEKVASSPRIKERIPTGSANIDGMENMQEAQDLAVVLRAGALPAPVEVIEERTVGPSLGQDSITKGTNSAIIGIILVALFMIIYYRMSGIIADIALLLNIFLLLAALAGLHATLTLPGVAGIVLTIGMAVDANVLIFERIREELRTGKTIRAAIDSGYGRAFRTILDANVTTLLTAVVLYQFGTGPIRGFATTLSIGLIANMYTAIIVTRMIFDYITTRFSPSKLSI